MSDFDKSDKYVKRMVKPDELNSLTNVINSILQSDRYVNAADKANCLAYNLLLRGFRHEDIVSKECFNEVMNIFKGEDR